MKTLITALSTPYKEGKIDCYSYEKLLDYQIKNGVDMLLAVGTTAEAQLLSACEKKLLIKLAKGIASSVPVFVGIEGRSTRDAVNDAVLAESLGADGLLIAPPAFVKCTPQGYLQHVLQIRKVVSIPLMLYNAPSRCNYVLDETVVEELSASVTYLKDAGSDLGYTKNLASKLSLLCGNDILLTEFLQRGACGVVSVVSNVAPQLTREILEGNLTAKCGDTTNIEVFTELARLSMLEVSPIAIKYMLYKKGIFDSYEMRLPLTPASVKTQEDITKFWSKI